MFLVLLHQSLLIGIKMIKLDSFSRFKKTDMIIVDGHETFGRWTMFNFLKERPPEDKIRVYNVTADSEGRPDRISNEIYNTPLLDWVLIAFNNVRDPLNWPKSGITIEYPVDTIVLPELY